MLIIVKLVVLLLIKNARFNVFYNLILYQHHFHHVSLFFNLTYHLQYHIYAVFLSINHDT